MTIEILPIGSKTSLNYYPARFFQVLMLNFQHCFVATIRKHAYRIKLSNS